MSQIWFSCFTIKTSVLGTVKILKYCENGKVKTVSKFKTPHNFFPIIWTLVGRM